MTVHPAVTVILPCLNGAEYLADCLPAYIACRHLIKELIFIDDGSTDGTLEHLENYRAQLPPLKILRHAEPAGTVASLNEALTKATAHYVYLGAVDDVIDSRFLGLACEWMQRHPQAGLCSALSYDMDIAGQVHGVFPTPLPTDQAAYLTPAECQQALLNQDSWFMGNVTLYDREKLAALGDLDPELGGFSDCFAAWLLALRYGACFLPQPLGSKRDIHAGIGSSLFDDPRRARHIWAYAGTLVADRHAGLFPAKLWHRLQKRWQYNICRRQLWRRLIAPTQPPAALRVVLFRIASILAAMYLKPWDFFSILGRRLRLKALLSQTEMH